MSARQRLTFAAIAVAIAVVAIVVLAAGGGSADDAVTTSATPTPSAQAGTTATATATATAEPEQAEPRGTTISVRDGQPVGGIEEIEVSQGDDVVFTVRSDVTDHVHVHGYDVLRDVDAGGRARFDFKARITGVFEVELEESGVQIASLTVNP